MRARSGMRFKGSVLLACLCGAEGLFAQAAIDWIEATRVFACAGTYGRVKRLSDGGLVLVYSRGADACMRKSTGVTAAWGAEVVVARTPGYSNTNAELIELEGGRLLYGWNGRPTAGGPYVIATKISRDRGASWTDESRVYTAGAEFGVGCWEPAFLETPAGVEIYFANEAPYPGADTDQEIGMMRSGDGGLTWKEYAAISHRKGGRDGMPVPVRLSGGRGVALAIEDNGVDGAFKPVILHADAMGGWGASAIGGGDVRRKLALSGPDKLAGPVYAGAPYLVRMPDGTTVLSVQSTEGRPASADPVAVAVMRVYVGEAGAVGFTGGSMPFPSIPGTGNGVWNSLEAIDDSTVMAVSAVRGLGRDGLWTVLGRLKRNPSTRLCYPENRRSAEANPDRRTGEKPGEWPGSNRNLIGRWGNYVERIPKSSKLKNPASDLPK